METHVYDQFAQLEENHFWFVSRRRIFFDLLDQTLQNGDGEPRRDLEILEIGCGAGGMLEPLARYGRVTALDYSSDAMRYCRSRGFPRVVAGGGDHLPFPDDSFDLIGLFDVIEHIDRHDLVLSEVKRVLKPGGRVFISVPAYQFLYSQNDRVAQHLRRYTARSLRAVIQSAGLGVQKISYFNTLLFPLIMSAVMVVKLKEKLFGLPEGQTNLTHQLSRPVNTTFGMIMASERFLLRHIEFPFGHSLIAMAG